MEDALRKARLDIHSLNSMLRKKNVFSVSDVDYAFFETDGSLSGMKKEHLQPVTKSDMNIRQEPTLFSTPIAVISAGKIIGDNLRKIQQDETWLDQQLEAAGISSVEDVFYALIQKDGTLYIDNNNALLH